MFKVRLVSACLVILCTFVAGDVVACHVYEPAFSRWFRGSYDPNSEINDYARILNDADNQYCAEAARDALIDKLASTPAGAWGGWLWGANVTYVFAAALRIGAHGYATPELDQRLQSPIINFHFTGDPTGCYKESVNQCVDDYAVSAPGFAWIAAYLYRRGDPWADTYRNNANQLINAAFDEVCIRTGDATTLCNGSWAQLNDGSAYTLSLNNGQQMPSYGFGLMTSIAMAQLGLEASGSTHYFIPRQQAIAQGLLREMKNAVDANGNFNNSCVTLSRDANGVYHTHPGVNCQGPGKYHPGMYVLNLFYRNYLGGYPSGGYQSSSQYYPFEIGPYHNSWFSWGRYMGYVVMPDDWVRYPRQYLPFDHYDPEGFLNGITADGVVHGWSCDQDVPTNRVEIYANGQYVTGAPADGYSGWSVCGSPWHYFAFQLPSWTRGMTITAKGKDYTGHGDRDLPCLQNPCTW